MLTIDVVREAKEVECKSCGEILPWTLANFRRNGNGKPSRMCKNCYNAQNRERWPDRRERIKNSDPTEGKRFLQTKCAGCGIELTRRDAGLCPKCKPRLSNLNCASCTYMLHCKERVHWGAWVLCERGDENDYIRMRALKNGG